MIASILIFFSIPISWTLLSIGIFKKNKKKGFYVLLTLVIFLFYFKYVDYIREYYKPGTHNFTLHDFIQKRTTDFQSFIVHNGTEKSILIIPNLPSYQQFLRLTSLTTTPPMYIFTSKGLFIDWTNNLDDDQEFYKKWNLSQKMPTELTERLKSVSQ